MKQYIITYLSDGREVKKRVTAFDKENAVSIIKSLGIADIVRCREARFYRKVWSTQIK